MTLEVENGNNEELPKFLILGGCGFIGRHLVSLLVDGKASKIFVIDKTPPEIAWMNERHLKAFKDPKVVYISANLTAQVRCSKAFESVDNDISYIIHLASETRKGQSDAIYKEGILKLGNNVLEEIDKKFKGGTPKYIHVSTGTLYPSDKKAHSESDKIDTWSSEAKYKSQLEKSVKTHGKNFVIIRPAIVYGPGDRDGLTPRLVIGAVYQHLNEMMKLPWNEELRTHTIHVVDLVRAIYHLCLNGKNGEIYNAVDSGDTTQGIISSIVSSIFNLNHDYWGTTFTTMAKLDATDMIEDINEKHMGPWASICASYGVQNTPLSPCVYNEALIKHHVSLDGKKLLDTGFTLTHPKVSKELLLDVLRDFSELNLFPKVVDF